MIRPRRSFLYVPGANTRALAKIWHLAVDGVILDLEDSVAPDQKHVARHHILHHLSQVVHEGLHEGPDGNLPETLVRINDLDSPWGRDDITALAQSGVCGIVAPKINTAEDVQALDHALEEAGAPDTLALWGMIETPKSVLQLEAITQASSRLAGLVMGTSDLAKELGCAHPVDRMPFLTSLSLAVLAARAAGLAILDGVHPYLDDMAGFEAACHQGRSLGFDGKTLIHPKTITVANMIFGPSEDEIEEARILIKAFEDAILQGKGVTVVNGKLIENLHVAQARDLLAMAEHIAERNQMNDRMKI